MARSTSPLALALAKADAEYRPALGNPFTDDNETTRPVSAALIARMIRQSDPTMRLCLELPEQQPRGGIQVDDEAEILERDGER